MDEVVEVMTKVGVPAGRVVTVKEVVEGEQVKARGAIREVWVPGTGGGSQEGSESVGWNVKMQGTFPVLEGVDPQPKWAGPDLGFHTDEVLMEDLGLSSDAVAKLKRDGIIE